LVIDLHVEFMKNRAKASSDFYRTRSAAKRMALQEVRVHIHGNPVNLPLYNLESAAAAQKSAAEKQAAQVRKQLLSNALDPEGVSDLAYRPVGGDQGQSRQRPREQSEARSVAKSAKVEEKTATERGISVWA